MLDFETEYDAQKTKLTKLTKFETEFLSACGKARPAPQACPRWAPAIVLATVAGHHV